MLVNTLDHRWIGLTLRQAWITAMAAPKVNEVIILAPATCFFFLNTECQ